MFNVFEQVRMYLAARKDRRVQKALAVSAAAWLDDDTLNQALATMRRATENTWLTSKDPEVRERCWLEMQRINKFVESLKGLVQTETAELAIEKRRDSGAR